MEQAHRVSEWIVERYRGHSKHARVVVFLTSAAALAALISYYSRVGKKPKKTVVFYVADPTSTEARNLRLFDLPSPFSLQGLKDRVHQELALHNCRFFLHGQGPTELTQRDLVRSGQLVVVVCPPGQSLVMEGLQVPPGPPPKPFIGNALDFRGSLDTIPRLALKYGPCFRLVIPDFGNLVFLCDPPAIESIITNPTVWPKLHMKKIRGPRNLPKGIFTTDDDEELWGIAHRILLPAFALHGMKKYFDSIQECTTDLLEEFDKLAATGEAFDPNPWFAKFTFEVIGRVALGKKFNAIKSKELHPFLHNFELIMEARNYARDHPIQSALFSRSAWKGVRVLNERQNEFLLGVIAEKRRLLESGAKEEDLTSLMLQAVDPKTGQKLPDDNIVDQLLTFLVAGHDSTSTALTFLFYELAQAPDVEAHVVREVLAQIGQRSLKWEDMSRIPYCTQVIKEGLRKHPPATSFVKTSAADTKVGPYSVPAGTSVLISILATHMNPAVYPNPERFDPERFSEENTKKRNQYSWIPFSSGPRACIGQQLSLLEQKSLIASLSRRFAFRVDPDTNLKITLPLFVKPSGILVRLHKVPDYSTGSTLPAPLPVPSPALPSTATEHAHYGKNAVGNKLLIAVGSNMGTSQTFASQVAAEGESFGFTTEVISLDALANLANDPSAAGKFDPKKAALLVITSTYNGFPPDNAEHFHDWVAPKPGAPNLSKNNTYFRDVNFAVFGCGNTQWKTYQAFPTLVDRELERLGGNRFVEKGQGDADSSLEEDFLRWKNNMWLGLHEQLGITVAEDAGYQYPVFEIQSAETPNFPGLASFLSQQGVVTTTLLENRELQNPTSGRSTRHLTFALPTASSQLYNAGDHLGVVPKNHPDVVQQAVTTFGLTKEDLKRPVIVKTTTSSATQYTHIPFGVAVPTQLLLDYAIDLQAIPNRTAIAFLASKASQQTEKQELEKIADTQTDAYKDLISTPKRSILEVLNKFKSVVLNLAEILAIVPPLKPRFYSISSSPKVSPEAADITVVVLGDVTAGGRRHYGACSDFLKRSSKGDQIRVFVKDTKSSFRLPANGDTPVIMVGPGTGFAPMRGFLQERHSTKCKGENLLYFGCRNNDDFIYREEIERYPSEGPTTVRVALSRATNTKVYVQDKLWEDGERVWSLLSKNGAHVYVCGDAKYMAKDIRKTLVKIASTYGHLEAQEADAFVTNLSATKRYSEDVWAST